MARYDPNDKIVNSDSFKFNIKITEKITTAGNRKNTKIAVPFL